MSLYLGRAPTLRYGSPPSGLAFGSVLRTRFAALQAAHARSETTAIS